MSLEITQTADCLYNQGLLGREIFAGYIQYKAINQMGLPVALIHWSDTVRSSLCIVTYNNSYLLLCANRSHAGPLKDRR